MNRSLRFFARILDYAWYYGFILIFLDLFDCSYPLYFLTFALLPILFVPIEFLQLKLFRTTFAKALFGIRYNQKLSFKQAFSIAGNKGVILQPLFLPVLGIFYAIFYWKELRTHETNRWDVISGAEICSPKQAKLPRAVLFALAIAMSAFVLFPEPALQKVSEIAGIEIPAIIKKGALKDFSSWSKVTPQDRKFSIFFPSQPKFQEKDYPVPNSSKKLHVKEYHHEGKLHLTLTYTTLPTTWTIWGSNRVLKTALTQMEKYIGHVEKKRVSTHRSYPAMEYVLKNSKGAVMGKLILVKNTLYRVEAISAKALDDEAMEIASQFIDSLEIKRS